VKAEVEALLIAVNEDIHVNFRSCDVSKEIQPLKLGKACGFDGIPNEFLQHLPRRSLVHLRYLFNHCLRPSHFPVPWKEATIITAENQQRSKTSPKFLSEQPLVHY
jgi:hypothetical protein